MAPCILYFRRNSNANIIFIALNLHLKTDYMCTKEKRQRTTTINVRHRKGQRKREKPRNVEKVWTTTWTAFPGGVRWGERYCFNMVAHFKTCITNIQGPLSNKDKIQINGDTTAQNSTNKP